MPKIIDLLMTLIICLSIFPSEHELKISENPITTNIGGAYFYAAQFEISNPTPYGSVIQKVESKWEIYDLLGNDITKNFSVAKNHSYFEIFPILPSGYSAGVDMIYNGFIDINTSGIIEIVTRAQYFQHDETKSYLAILPGNENILVSIPDNYGFKFWHPDTTALGIPSTPSDNILFPWWKDGSNIIYRYIIITWEPGKKLNYLKLLNLWILNHLWI